MEYQFNAKILHAGGIAVFPERDAERLAHALTSNNPASESVAGKSRGKVAQLAAMIAPALLEKFGAESVLEISTTELDGEDVTVKTRKITLANVEKALRAVIDATRLAELFRNSGSYEVTTTRERGKRGRKAGGGEDVPFSLPA